MEFSKKLKEAMRDLDLNQKQVCGITGCSKGSVSQYLAGKNIPTIEKQKAMAISLGLSSDYFEEDKPVAVMPREALIGRKIQRLLPEEVAPLLKMDKKTVRQGLQQGVFPWGYAIRTSKNRWTYFINAKRFVEIEGVKCSVKDSA